MMRVARLVFVALALTGVAVPASAQAGFGLVGGLVSASISAKQEGTTFDYSSLTSFAAGIGLRMGSSGASLMFAPEALYVMKGATQKTGGPDSKLKFSYLEVPLLLRANLGSSGGTMKPFMLAGPSIALKLSCKAVADSESSDCTDFSDSDAFKSLDFGLMVGAGADFGKIGVSVRYDLGLANVAKQSGFSLKHKALMLLGSVSF